MKAPGLIRYVMILSERLHGEGGGGDGYNWHKRKRFRTNRYYMRNKSVVTNHDVEF